MAKQDTSTGRATGKNFCHVCLFDTATLLVMDASFTPHDFEANPKIVKWWKVNLNCAADKNQMLAAARRLGVNEESAVGVGKKIDKLIKNTGVTTGA